MRCHHIRWLISAVGLLLVWPAFGQVDATLMINNARLQGTHAGGSLLLYSPDPVQSGSSISHWDTTATPNLLMEPLSNGDLPFLGLDVTPAQMQDVFWSPGTLNVNIFDSDPPGVGFTDPRPFPGAPGNPATTLGEARVNLFNAVLGAWANTLSSTVDVDVIVTWQDLPCIGGVGAVLGAAGTTSIILLEDGGLPGPTFFHAALAESLVGSDLTGPVTAGGGDIIVFMNGAIDDECLAPGTGWYYGLDGMTPAGFFDAGGTLLHELSHGLGFSNFTNELTGAQAGGLPGIYDLFTFDNTKGLFWDQMTNAERAQSAANSGQVTWEGPTANAAAAGVLDPGVPELVISAPPDAAGTYDIAGADFGGVIPPGGLVGEIVCMTDDVADATYFNGCTAATNALGVAGKIALIERGACGFTTKVANAQAAGAIAAIVDNRAGNSVFTMGGIDPAITIPAVIVGRADGNRIRQAAGCPVADLSITKTDSADPILVEGNLTYTVTVTNNGPSKAKDVVVTDNLPVEMTLVSTSGCAEDAVGVPICTLGTIGAGNSKGFVITVTADAPGTLINSASVSSSTTEGSPGDESASQATTVFKKAPPVPTLSRWGLVLLLVLILAARAVVLLRHKALAHTSR